MAAPEHRESERGFIIHRNGEFAGPFSRNELAVQVADGSLDEEELVQVAGTPLWQPVRIVLESFEPTESLAGADDPPSWEQLARWVALRLRWELARPSVPVTGAFLGIGAAALICSRWPFLFWLPWIILALIGAAALLLAGRKLVGLALIVASIGLPMVLLPSSRTSAPAPEDRMADSAPPKIESAPPVSQPSKAAPYAPARSTPLTAEATPAPVPSLIQRLGSLVSGWRGAAASSPAPQDAPPSPAAIAAPTPSAPAAPSLSGADPAVPPLPTSSLSSPIADVAPLPAPVASPEPPEAKPEKGGAFVNSHSRALVVVKDDHGAGSGFISSMGGRVYLFTNIHVAAGLKQPEFTLLDGTRLSPVTAEAAVGHDIMRFTLKDPPVQFIESATNIENSIRIGAGVFVLGNSGGGGVVTNLPGVLHGIGPDRIEVTSEFIPGNSGSPIIHAATGRVIGIATYLTKRYDEIASSAGEGPGKPTVRRFGYRLDSVRTWEPVNWAVFHAEAEQLRKISELTEDIFNFFEALQKHQSPDFATATLRQPAEEWLRTIKKQSSKQRTAEADRLGATQSFLGSLRMMTQADVLVAERNLHYSYFRDELRHERDVRDRLAKGFNDQAQELATVAARGH